MDLKDHERGLVSIEGRFSHVLPPGLFSTSAWSTGNASASCPIRRLSCIEQKLIIQIESAYHDFVEEGDESRQQQLEPSGWTVLPFSNGFVCQSMLKNGQVTHPLAFWLRVIEYSLASNLDERRH